MKYQKYQKYQEIQSSFKIILIVVIIILSFVLGFGIYKDKQLSKVNAKAAEVFNKNLLKKDTKQVEEEKAVPQKAVEQKAVEQNAIKYKDKVWYAIGDTITAENIYPRYLHDMLQLKSYVNDSILGQQMRTMADRVTSVNLAKVDLVTVFGGANDYALGKSLGTIADNKNTNTFYGNIQMVIDKIKTANPKVEIVFMTPTKSGKFKYIPVYPAANSSGLKLEQYVQAIKDVCSKNSVKVIDLFNLSGIDQSNLSVYTKDNLHPNEAGSKKIDQVIQTELEK